MSSDLNHHDKTSSDHDRSLRNQSPCTATHVMDASWAGAAPGRSLQESRLGHVRHQDTERRTQVNKARRHEAKPGALCLARQPQIMVSDVRILSRRKKAQSTFFYMFRQPFRILTSHSTCVGSLEPSLVAQPPLLLPRFSTGCSLSQPAGTRPVSASGQQF